MYCEDPYSVDPALEIQSKHLPSPSQKKRIIPVKVFAEAPNSWKEEDYWNFVSQTPEQSPFEEK
jgi:hypothetical protein